MIQLRRTYTEDTVATQRLAIMVLDRARREAAGEVLALRPYLTREMVQEDARRFLTTDTKNLRKVLYLAGVEEHDLDAAVNRLKEVYGNGGA